MIYFIFYLFSCDRVYYHRVYDNKNDCFFVFNSINKY